MTSIPFGVHAAQKVRANMNLTSNVSHSSKNGNKWHKDQNADYSYSSNQRNLNSFILISWAHSLSAESEVSPSKYCDKMMNSIWGLYNRYSVHNFKSSTSSGYTLPQQSGLGQDSKKPVKCPLDRMFNLNAKNFQQWAPTRLSKTQIWLRILIDGDPHSSYKGF